MCRNGSGVVQLELSRLVVYKQFYVHHLYGETNIRINHVLKVQAFQYLRLGFFEKVIRTGMITVLSILVKGRIFVKIKIHDRRIFPSINTVRCLGVLILQWYEPSGYSDWQYNKRGGAPKLSKILFASVILIMCFVSYNKN
jgi:hypothetical protein